VSLTQAKDHSKRETAPYTHLLSLNLPADIGVNADKAIKPQTEELNHVSCELMDVGFLDRYQRPLPVMNDYDQLLAQGGAQ
jgi:hypothetical protein